MISRKNQPPILYLSTPSPEQSPPASTIFSDCEADDEDAMSEDLEPVLLTHSNTLHSGPISPVGPLCSRIPTLHDILANNAAPPYTLGAFTAYLHQNHCLENLEFIKEADRYRKKHDAVVTAAPGMPLGPEMKESEELRMLWDKLLHAYIKPNAPREINIPGDVRDLLMSRPNHTTPPGPDTLDNAIRKVTELMNESILMNFINELSPSRASEPHDDSDERQSHRSEESRSRSRKTSPNETSHVPKPLSVNARHSHHSHTSLISKSRLTMHASNSSAGSNDVMLTDDSGSLASLSNSPMTPPTTPPSSDLGGTSPKLRQGHHDTWKKMMGLGLRSKKKPVTAVASSSTSVAASGSHHGHKLDRMDE